MSRPFLIVALYGDDDMLATAALTSAAADQWTVELAGGQQLSVTGEATVRAFMEQLGAQRPQLGGEDYEREDPETAAPLPPGACGFRCGGPVGRRRR
jgi:hypothetical protein